MSSEIRLTNTSYIVLGMLDAAGESTPYDLKLGVAASLGNFWSLQHAAALLRARTAGRRGLSDRAPRAEGQAPQALQDHRQGPKGAGGLAGGDDRRAARAPRQGAAQGLLRRRPRPAGDAGSSPPTGRNWRSTNASSSSAARDLPSGVRITLEGGIAHEREWLRFWSRAGGVSYSESSTRSIVCGSSGRSPASVAVPSIASTASIPRRRRRRPCACRRAKAPRRW